MLMPAKWLTPRVSTPAPKVRGCDVTVKQRIKRRPIRVIIGYRIMMGYDGHARFIGKYRKPIREWRTAP